MFFEWLNGISQWRVLNHCPIAMCRMRKRIYHSRIDWLRFTTAKGLALMEKNKPLKPVMCKGSLHGAQLWTCITLVPMNCPGSPCISLRGKLEINGLSIGGSSNKFQFYVFFVFLGGTGLCKRDFQPFLERGPAWMFGTRVGSDLLFRGRLGPPVQDLGHGGSPYFVFRGHGPHHSTRPIAVCSLVSLV